MTTNAQLVADLRGMKAYLEQHGWIQGKLEDLSGACCLYGARYQVVYQRCAPDEHSIARARAVSTALFDVLPPSVHAIADWNDAPGRTFPEVLALLDAAIARAEKGGAE